MLRRETLTMPNKCRMALLLTAGSLLGACSTTARFEPYKQTDAVLEEGEGIVILARRHHSTHEAEQDFVECMADELSSGRDAMVVHDSTEFEDMLYPWFEPAKAPLNMAAMSELLDKPSVAERVADSGVRFVVWLDGSTDRVSSGGSITCAAGIGGAGCMGLAFWDDDRRHDAASADVAVNRAGLIEGIDIPYRYDFRPI